MNLITRVISQNSLLDPRAKHLGPSARRKGDRGEGRSPRKAPEFDGSGLGTADMHSTDTGRVSLGRMTFKIRD